MPNAVKKYKKIPFIEKENKDSLVVIRIRFLVLVGFWVVVVVVQGKFHFMVHMQYHTLTQSYFLHQILPMHTSI